MISKEWRPVNIGNPRELTVRQFAEAILRLTGSRSRIVSKPLPQDDPKQRQPDITRARKTLKWEPQVDLDEGLTRTIEWFRERIARDQVSPSGRRRRQS
jgi:dTDP-glucose 4,6-dehydratase